MNIIIDNKINRYTVLSNFYIAVGGHYEVVKDIRMISEHNAVSNQDFKSAFKYLLEEGLIDLRQGDHEYYVSITHKGVKAIEDVFINTNEPTYYFPAFRDIK